MQLPKYWKGEKLRATKLNDMVDFQNQLDAFHGPRQVFDKRRKYIYAISKQFQLIEAFGDHLTAYELEDGILGEDLFLIAKPYLLRRTPFDGVGTWNGITYAYTGDSERTATIVATSATENQVIVPAYSPGHIINAVRPVKGGTGVEINAIRVEWLEISCARVWAKKYV